MRSLSELPDELIKKIVSHVSLTDQEAIVLSLVSKDFSSAVRSRRILVFDHHTVSENRYKEEINSLHSTLTKYLQENINLDKFSFQLTGDESEFDVQNECINLAIRLSPKILILRLLSCPDPGQTHPSLPQSVFGAESVVDLSLKICDLRPEGIILWSNLRRLRLEHVCMERGVFEKMMRSSPMLEILQIYWCNGYPFNLSFRHCCQNLRILSLHGVLAYDGFLTDFKHKFPRLEVLRVGLNSEMQRINISSRSLKEIQLLRMDDLEEAHFDVPNVVRFAYRNGNNCYRPSIIPKLSFKGNSRGWISCVRIECRAKADFSWFLKMREFLAELNSSGTETQTSVSVSFESGVSFSKPDSVSSSPAALGAIKDVSVETFWDVFSPVSAKAIIDAIFWICSPRTIKFAYFGYSRYRLCRDDDPRNHQSVEYLQEVTCEDVFLKLSEAYAKKKYGPFILECRRSGHESEGERLKISSFTSTSFRFPPSFETTVRSHFVIR